MRKLLCAALAALFLLFSFSAFAENLLVNGDFSQLDEDGLPAFWYTDAYIMSRTQFAVEKTEDGKNCVTLTNAVQNDSRFVQEVPVKENTVYRITARIKAECSDNIDRMGACISVMDTHVYSEAVYDSEGEWKTIVLYVRTIEDQTLIKLAARFGGHGQINEGKAYFTDFTMEEAPLSSILQYGILPVSLNTIAPDEETVDIPDWGSVSVQTETAEPPERQTETHFAITFFTAVFFLYLIKYARNDKRALSISETKFGGIPSLTVLLTVGFLFRVYLAMRFRGYAVDIGNLMLWGQSFFKAGPAFYMQAGLHDYPPLYMLILGLADAVRSFFGIAFDSSAHAFVIKLTPILSDLILAVCAFFLSGKAFTQKGALALSAFLIINPAFLINSAAWGQVDSVFSLFVCLCLYFAVRGNWKIALPVFALSMLIKPQAMLFGPLGLTALIIDAVRSRRNRKALWDMLMGLLIAFAILYLCAFPFAVYEAHANGKGILYALVSPIPWLVNLYTGTTSGYSYITVNALNLYQLFGLNWVDISRAPGFNTLAWVLMAAGYVYTALLLILSKSKKALPLAGAVLISIIFSFGPMMHERYIFPIIPLLAYAFIIYKDKRLIPLLIVFSLTLYLNQALVLQCGMTKGYEYMGSLSTEEELINKILSCVNVFATLYLAFLAFEILVLKKKCKPLRLTQKTASSKPVFAKSDYRLHLTRRDCLIMSAVTVVYAAFAFLNLGTTKAPESYYKNALYGEQVVFDLGETETFRMTYYGGISPYTFTVALSNDGETWTEENYAVYNEGEIFRWLWYVPKTYENGTFSNASSVSSFGFSEWENAWENTQETETPLQGDAYVVYATDEVPYPFQTARYIRLTFTGVDMPLHEVGFWDVENEVLYPVKSISGTVEGAAYANLIDEQDTVAFTPSYLNGTYFDEIYHARTAYEFIHSLSVLEWSHPHLGKILIMLGIEIFGMNPFGWRFMGTLFGALMLPVMYLLVKQLTKKTSLSVIGMLFLAFDSMHFTQSRIATVDTYAVFFIMLMYLFMFRYMQMNMHTDKFSKTLVPLGLSGFSFALACATKWIGIYAGAGLAVLFFSSVTARFSEYLKARSMKKNDAYATLPKEEKAEIAETVSLFPARLVLTLLFCVLMFILVPVVIYFLTYYWHFAPTGEFNLKSVWEMQLQMFGYHNGLSGDTHFFRSPWYEWPLIKRPMWYYSADTAYTGLGVVSSISCMGNPIVWWTGAIAIAVVIILPAATKKTSKTQLLIAVGFLSQFLPWLLITRSTFIYHYFASVPFIILASVYLLGKLEKCDRYAFLVLSGTLCALALFLFIAFYPLESGYPCSYEYALRLRWFDWYNFALQYPLSY